jgi:peptidoglycan/LPS O-acetylase OafA/YrhL
VLLPARLDALASGALLALVARRPQGMKALRRWAGPVGGGTSAVLLALVVWQRGLPAESQVVQLVGYSLLAALFSAVLVLAATAPASSGLGRVLTAPALVYIGRISYGLYIVHHLVVFALQRHVVSVDRMPRVLGTQVLSQVVFSLIALGVSVLLAALSWHLYERPILHLKQRFPYHPPT